MPSKTELQELDRDYEATLAMFRRELEIAREGIDRMNPSVVLLNVQLEEPLRELARDCLDRLRGEAN